MSRFVCSPLLAVAHLCIAASLCAQQAGPLPASAAQAAPSVMRYTAAVPASKAPVEVRIAFYSAEQGGDPLWKETQRVLPDASGKTVLLLGSETSGGVPEGVFGVGQARWVGISIDGGEEQARTLLATSPYAFKAVDAETLGGHPASDFALAAGGLKPDGSVDVTQINTASGILGAGTGPTVSLTADPVYFNTYYGQLAAANAFTASNSFSKPIVSTVATGTAPFTVASTTAVPNLDASLLGGAAASAFPQLTLQNTFTNNQIIGPSAPATTSTGHSSYFLWMNASVWNSSKNAAQNIGFQWRAEPLDNDTASPNANFSLLSTVTSATPQETGFKITANGIITFVAGQTFPGAGTITGVTASTGLVGGGTTGTVSLGLDPAYTSTLATLSGANYFTNVNTFSAPIASVVATGTAPFSVASTTVVPNLNASYIGGIAASNIATLGGINQFTAAQALEPTGTATSSLGYGSNTLVLTASAYNSSSSAAQNNAFVWQAEPTGNNTSSPGATLDLQYTNGSTRPVETGFSLANNGIVTFASGQTFPGTGPGTITGVTASTGLTGGGTSGAVSLALNPTYLNANYSQLAAANTYSAAQTVNSTETITGSAADQLTVTTTASSGTAIDGYSASGTGVYGVTSTGTGTYGYASGTNGVGVRAYSASGTGVSAIGGTASGAYGVNASGFTAVNAAGSTASGGIGVNVTGATGVSVTGTTVGISVSAPTAITAGGSSTGTGVIASGYDGVFAASSVNGGAAIDAVFSGTGSNVGDGLDVSSTTGYAVNASGAGTTVMRVSGTAGEGNAIYAVTSGEGASALQGYASNATEGTGVTADGEIGVSTAGSEYGIFAQASSGAAIYGYADSGTSLYATNSSTSPTIYALNENTGANTNALTAGGQSGSCSISVGGNFACTGSDISSGVSVGGRNLQAHAVTAPESWMEDFGSSTLSHGIATVSLEALFHGAVNTGLEYHVFLTPQGDCEGLYISRKGPDSFEVRELRHGHSSIAFDYRIVAKTAGHEQERFVDVTDTLKAQSDLARQAQEKGKAHSEMIKQRQSRRALQSPPQPILQRPVAEVRPIARP